MTVAPAATLGVFSSLITKFKSAPEYASCLSSNNGRTLWTKIVVEPIPTFWIILVAGVIADSLIILALETYTPSTTISSFCLLHVIARSSAVSVVIPGPKYWIVLNVSDVWIPLTIRLDCSNPNVDDLVASSRRRTLSPSLIVSITSTNTESVKDPLK